MVNRSLSLFVVVALVARVARRAFRVGKAPSLMASSIPVPAGAAMISTDDAAIRELQRHLTKHGAQVLVSQDHVAVASTAPAATSSSGSQRWQAFALGAM